jgi:hypothetical protein
MAAGRVKYWQAVECVRREAAPGPVVPVEPQPDLFIFHRPIIIEAKGSWS